MFPTIEAARAARDEADITADAACQEVFERMQDDRIKLEILFAQNADLMLAAAA